MLSFEERWRPELNWDTPAGRILDRLVKALPKEHGGTIIVFGSSPLQLALDPSFLSGDVDVISSLDIQEHCRRAGLLKGQSSLYVDPCAPAAFTASPDWPVRACEIKREHVTFIFPHPIDILVSKIKRLEEKDLEAFRLVQTKTGHPTEDELLMALRRIVDVYRPSFDEEAAGDPRHNTVVLWRELFNKPINVAQQIIAPALEERRRNYGPQGYELRDALRKIT
jgi:uncharacterized nucleotidyltransferase DUF6036